MPKTEELDFIYVGPLEKVNKNTIDSKNNPFNPHKPHSVFWTSPVNPETGLSHWEEWCNNEDFRVYDPQIEQRLHIVPKKDCRILTLLPDSPELVNHDTDTIIKAAGKTFNAVPGMTLYDAINQKNGHNKIRVAVQGNEKGWQLKREYISKQYTTNLDDVIVLKVT